MIINGYLPFNCFNSNFVEAKSFRVGSTANANKAIIAVKLECLAIFAFSLYDNAFAIVLNRRYFVAQIRFDSKFLRHLKEFLAHRAIHRWNKAIQKLNYRDLRTD